MPVDRKDIKGRGVFDHGVLIVEIPPERAELHVTGTV